MADTRPNVIYCHSKEYLDVCSLPPKIRGRAHYIHKLLDAYGLLKEMRILPPVHLSAEELQLFHCKNYISCIQRTQNLLSDAKVIVDDDESIDELAQLELEAFGLGYDCPPFAEIMDYILLVAGASVKCADLLNEKRASIVINLYGGWHHAHRDSAAGFCYVNDIVLAILKLREKFSRILYIDIDVHHGDGIEEAFFTTDKVMTVSFHKLEDGYFPGTGRICDIGCGRGRYHTVNVPLKDGIDDQQYLHVFSRVMQEVRNVYQPDAIVFQCGADCLNGDPLGGFNLTNHGLANCVKFIAEWSLPLLVLGGGGYNFVNTAKAWTTMIAAILQKEISSDIPDHEYFADYAPSFDINTIPSIRRSQNSNEYLEEIINRITGNLRNIERRTPLGNLQKENREKLHDKAVPEGEIPLPSGHRKRTRLHLTTDENHAVGSHRSNTFVEEKWAKKARSETRTNKDVNDLKKYFEIEKLNETKKIFDFDDDF